jgi:hypothetical protein
VIFFFFFFWCFETGSSYAVQAGLELTVFLPSLLPLLRVQVRTTMPGFLFEFDWKQIPLGENWSVSLMYCQGALHATSQQNLQVQSLNSFS